jgi:hypothetical protein
LAAFRLEENIEHPLAPSNGMTARISSKYLMGRVMSGVLRLMMVIMISSMVSAGRMVVVASASTMTAIVTMTPAAGKEQTPAGGEQGGESQHKE